MKVNMKKMRNQFHRACGYYVGLSEFFDKKAAWTLYFYAVITSTTGRPLTPKFNLKIPLEGTK